MAFSIKIVKVSESESEVCYKYYSYISEGRRAEGRYDDGEYILNKKTYDIQLIKPMLSDTTGAILKRAVMRIVLLIRAGEDCPDKTFFQS
ncbi:hypothetical protein [Ignatzschineria sp. LJL83]